MKAYDRIFAPNAKDQQETDFMLCTNGHPHPICGLDQTDFVIVLTIEEASQLYNVGYSAGFFDAKKEDGQVYKDVPDFEAYLTSKGITI